MISKRKIESAIDLIGCVVTINVIIRINIVITVDTINVDAICEFRDDELKVILKSQIISLGGYMELIVHDVSNKAFTVRNDIQNEVNEEIDKDEDDYIDEE
uniref:Uncharacterized protein n=1 Tax=Romanomermis culicivorax TaxID=13658 RepID=A0A915HN62_ROMCU